MDIHGAPEAFTSRKLAPARESVVVVPVSSKSNCSFNPGGLERCGERDGIGGGNSIRARNFQYDDMLARRQSNLRIRARGDLAAALPPGEAARQRAINFVCEPSSVNASGERDWCCSTFDPHPPMALPPGRWSRAIQFRCTPTERLRRRNPRYGSPNRGLERSRAAGHNRQTLGR